MKKWEYKVVVLIGDKMEQALNEAGDEGYEIVGMAQGKAHPFAIMKREKQSESGPRVRSV